MKRAIFVASQKGGPGKSTTARALLDYYRTNAMSCAAYDADGRVGQLLQYYGTRGEDGELARDQDPMLGVGYFDIRDDQGRDMVLNALDTTVDVLLFDLPGGAVHELAKIIDINGRPSALFEEYQRRGFRPTLVIVITPILATIRTVSETVQLYGASADYVVVQNRAFGGADDFILFDGFTDPLTGKSRGGVGKQLLDQHHGVVIEMPALKGSTYALLDLYSLTFAAAIESLHLKLADRSRVYQWRQAMFAEFDKAGALLGLAAKPLEAKKAVGG